MRGSPATAWCRSTMVTTCRAVFAQLQSPDTSTRCSISMGADTSPWPSKTSNCRLTRSTPSPISKPSSASASNQRVARMPPRQRWSPNWQTSLRGMNWKCLSQESSHSRMCARRFDRSNCATPGARWCCDHTQQGPEKEPDTGKLCLIPGLGGGNNTEEEWMNTETKLGGNFTLPGTSPTYTRLKLESIVSSRRFRTRSRARLRLSALPIASGYYSTKLSLPTELGSMCLELVNITGQSFWILLRKRYWQQRQ